MGNCWSLCQGNRRHQSTLHERASLLHSKHVSSSCPCRSEQTLSSADLALEEQEVLSKIVLNASERLINMYALTSEKPSLPDTSGLKMDDLKRLEQLTAPEIPIYNGLISIGMTRKELELMDGVAKLVKEAIKEIKTIKNVGQVIVKLDESRKTG
ncbi:hypothetical protein PNEG_02094 [Pneumocystis murina B123]|uniref:Uncharacterized protein n=1 Tax=Pneumocystis murina (strain B123) TaxID=1069680 RepID=M7NQW8_PNEMU|nr:hypothetical protein PNEG_02094 [Pneumocystis murina B123]EMR09506.1 hypothetical protein PNEG_02094 [Pneumocystis murina B123]